MNNRFTLLRLLVQPQEFQNSLSVMDKRGFLTRKVQNKSGNGTSVPENGAFIPENGAFIPENGAFIPENGAFIPENGAFIPDDFSSRL
jgi:hypothetical protein